MRQRDYPIHSAALVSLWALMWGAVACEGTISDPAGGPGGAQGPGGPGQSTSQSPIPLPPGAIPECGSKATRGAARESVRRLTRDELQATLSALLPVADRVKADVDAFQDLAANDAPERFVELYSEGQATQWLSVADSVGSLMETDASLRDAVSSDPCLDATPVADACWSTVLTSFLPRAFRRPVAADEVALYAAPLSGKNAGQGLHEAMLRILMSPDFLFHVEEGGAVDGTRVRLTSHEVANRIAYLVTGSMPDATLSQAAQDGALETLEQVASQVARLSTSPAAQQRVKDFFGAWLNVGQTSNPDPPLYEQWAKLPGTADQAGLDLQRDVSEFLDAVVLKEKGSFADVMTKPASYTKSDALAAIYGVNPAQITQGQAYTTPDHAGLPLRALFLVGAGQNTHPITRGVRYLRRIMCEDLPTPDPTIIAMRDAVMVDPLTMPNHEMTTKITSAPTCQVCHTKINPIGFVLESYDPLGRKRTQQDYIRLLDSDGGEPQVEVSATFPLPGPQQVAMASLQGTFSSPPELAQAVADSPAAGQCMSRYLVRHFQRRVESESDSCALAEVSALLKSDRPVLDAFIYSIASEDIFWRGL